ncbi:SET-binding protein [Oncorhynchus mykiss]|uniref:SET-binding protein n=1 Tax=Oncorhynchus mykiss TaxID=8022 RepID=UPI0018788AEE|nr:SET-binding protein [Oncorhynchus mykiss]
MEPRDLVGSARPKEAELGGGRAEPEEEEQERAGLGPASRGDEVIGDVMGERWGSQGEGEGLEEQEFSIKEASFQEGSLKLKIQTTKRIKKPPKSLENYICPPEIRMTIRPPSGEGRGGRLGGRAAQDKGPPRKRTYERPFKAAEPREGGLLQLLGDVTPPKHQPKPSILHTTPLPPHTLTYQPQQQHTQPPKFTHQHTHSPSWATPPSAPPANPVHAEPSREPAGANRSPLSDLAPSFLKPPMKRVPGSPSPRSYSPSPHRHLSPDPVLPVVTDASILNLTSLSRGRGLQEVSEQLFGNIKRKYGRKDPQRTQGNTHNAELPWGRRAEKDAESPIVPDERQKFRREETPELEREEKERESIGRTGEEEEREMPTLGAPVLMEEGKGRKRRRRRSLQESLTQEDQSEQLQGTDITERNESGPPEPKVSHKMKGHKMESYKSESRSGRGEEGSQPEADGDRGENGERADRAEKGERGEKGEKGARGDKGEKAGRGERGMSGADMESAMIQSWVRKNPVGRPRSSTDPHKHPDPNPSPRLPSPNLNHIHSPRSSLNPNPTLPNLSPGLNPIPNTSPKLSPYPRPPKTKDRWSYLKSRSPPGLIQRESGRSPLSTMSEPPSAFPITPSSPLYTNTDSLTVHTPAKRKRGRPKKQPLLTVETIHEGTSTSPLSPLARENPAGLSRRRKTHTLTTLAQITSGSISPNANGLKLQRSEGGHVRSVKKLKLGKVQSILNEILSGSGQHGSLALKSASAPVSSTMTAMASTIEAHLGKQINVSKRGTIYIGKKRGRKPRSNTQTLPHRGGAKPPLPVPMSSLYNSLLVPSTLPPSSTTLLLRPSHTLSSLCLPGPRGPYSDSTMPSLQPISALPSKPLGRGLLGAGWKLSPPLLLANSPSHLSEGAASVKEVTLSPISESHSEETIPSDSGIGTDNNSTSDQTEKGTNARRRYSFDLSGFEAAEAAALEASSRGSRGRCVRQAAVVDNFMSQQEKKQKHRRKRKCLQSRDHLHFLSELEEVVVKLQQLHVSHRRYASCYPQHPYPSIFRLNFHHHYYPLTYDPYPCDPAPYLRRTAELKAKRRRGRPAKASEPITSKLPFVQGFGYPLAGGNYYAPYAMPYAPPLSLGYYPPAPSLYLPHHSHSPSPPSHFMRPAVPPPKFHSGGHSKLQAGAKLRTSSGPLQASSGRGEGLGSLGGDGGGVRLHKRKHKHKHKHKEETPLLSPHDRQELGGLFSGAKTNGLLNLLTDRREMNNPKHQEQQRGGGRGSRGGSRGAMFESDPLSSLSMDHVQFRPRMPGQPMSSFLSSYRSQSQWPELTSDLFRLREEGSGRGRRRGLAVFGEEGVMSFHNARKEKSQETEEPFHNASPTLTGKRRYKRHEVEQIHGEVRRMCSLNNVLNSQRSFEHVQKILRVKRLQRQAKTGNNVVKRRPGRPRKHPIDDSEPTSYGRDEGRGFGMPVLERCVDLPGRRSLRPSPIPQPLEFSNHDSISVAIETVVHRARSLAPPPARGRKRRGRCRREEGGDMAFH